MTRFLVADGLAEPPSYSHVAVLPPGAQLVVTSGAVPVGPAGDVTAPGDHAGQAALAVRNLQVALEAAGSALESVVKITVYVATTDRDDLLAVWDVVVASPLSAAPVAATLLGVSLLGYPGQLVEIEALALAGPPAP
jgi:enamine deaminase RidA (YjgF/YER057c/UK114 family)